MCLLYSTSKPESGFCTSCFNYPLASYRCLYCKFHCHFTSLMLPCRKCKAWGVKGLKGISLILKAYPYTNSRTPSDRLTEGDIPFTVDQTQHHTSCSVCAWYCSSPQLSPFQSQKLDPHYSYINDVSEGEAIRIKARRRITIVKMCTQPLGYLHTGWKCCVMKKNLQYFCWQIHIKLYRFCCGIGADLLLQIMLT